MKRLFDISVSAVTIAIVWPALAVIAVAIKVDSKGSVFFRQERVGRDGITFHIHKFRSMRVEHSGELVSATGDKRVTRIGSVLRRSKLDELPQLFDVLAGYMSLVGPRPEVPEYVSLWPTEQRAAILSVRPGITDPASISLRNEADELATTADPLRHYIESLLPRKTATYVEYVANRSFVGDLAIILRTLVILFRR